jgi:fructokinase
MDGSSSKINLDPLTLSPSGKPAPLVATAGEALMDLVAQTNSTLLPCLGGAVYNLTRALARQGVPTAYLNFLSQDRFGRQLSDQLMADGVILASPLPVPEPTSLAVVHLDPQGKPAYSFYRERVADRALPDGHLQSVTRALNSVRWIATGCLALAPEDQSTYLSWLADSRAAGLSVAIDINLRPAVVSDLDAYRRNVFQALRFADIVKASDDDLSFLFAVPGFPSEAQTIALGRQLFNGSPAQWVCITLGAAGACLLDRQGASWWARDPESLAVVDTVGAGDCFFAGFLTALISQQRADVRIPSSQESHQDSLVLCDRVARAALTRAIASASYCVQQSGCVPPSSGHLGPEQLTRIEVQLGK